MPVLPGGSASPRVEFIKLDARAQLPAYMSPGAAGMDIRALGGPFRLDPGARTAIPTGLAMRLPSGFEAQVRPRSGLALRHGITLANAPGTIDSDYRGEIKVLVVNLASEPYTIESGDRIAQLVIAPVVQAEISEASSSADFAQESTRGSGGFGSTGR